MNITPRQAKQILVVMLAAGIGAVIVEHFLKPGFKGTLGL